MRDIFSMDFGLTALTVSIEDGFIVETSFGEGECTPDPSPESRALWERAREQLGEYFAGTRREFDLPIRYNGTDFQQKVWDALCKIPYGQVRTYGEIAAELGRPRASRAVGGACHRNRIVVIIPCHRVVGAGGSLTGFAGGLDTKKRLLELEAGERSSWQ